MASGRVVVGSTGSDGDLRRIARRLRDAGREVVLAGAGQTAEQLVRTAVAEDVDQIVIPADDASVEALRRRCRELGADDVEVVLADEV